jgi:hypothetical protein
MSILDDYILATDFVRKEFNLTPTTSIYEMFARIVWEYKTLKERLNNPPKPEEKHDTGCQGKPKGRTRKLS